MIQEYTHTVVCFNDKTLTQSFDNIEKAVKYANKLLRKKHQCKIYPYRPKKSYVDYIAQRGPDE